MRAERGRAPKTNNIGQSPSGPMVEWGECTVNCRISMSVSTYVLSEGRCLLKARRSGAWKRSTISMISGVSMGASSTFTHDASRVSFICFDT